VIPMHYASFPVLKGTPGNFQEELLKLGMETEVIVLAPGESREFQITL